MLSKAVAIDIDGVILRGKQVIPRAVEALKRLQKERIPYVFVSNGGGVTESYKANDMTKKLNFPIRNDQILLSHTPMKDLAPLYKNKRVLILGSDSCLEVASSYGFNDIVNCNHIHSENPHSYPTEQPGLYPEHFPKTISAAFIFHDPIHWGLEMQMLTDIFAHKKNYESPPCLYSSNSDVVYMNEHNHPRFTQGAFLVAFQGLYENYVGESIEITRFGKPYKVQYSYAERMLRHQCQIHGFPAPTLFFGIGDNPKSDVRGARNAGDNWKSVLVRTGVFSGQNDDIDPADFVEDDIFDAVNRIVAYKHSQ